MREFKVSCIDPKTKGQMVLEDCSFNEACSWIDIKYHPKDIKINRIDLSRYSIVISDDVKFIYDETRGYLIKK